MLPALITKPKQAVRQVNSLTNDSIDSYANMPFDSSTDTRVGVTYVDNTESGSGTARASPLASGRAAIKTRCAVVSKTASDEDGMTMARVLRDRKASGEEELSLRAGDIVKVLSVKRTGYLKCEAGVEIGYIPSSYLEFLDSGTEFESCTTLRNRTNEEAQQAVEKQHKKQRQKEKRRKEKQDSHLAVETHTAVAVADERPRKRKKKPRRNRESDVEDVLYRDKAEEGHLSARSRAAPADTDRSYSKSKHSRKKRHHGFTSSESSGSNGGKRSGRHGRHRHSEFESSSSDDSAESNRRRRRRHHHRHRRTSSDDDDENDSDYKIRARRSKHCRDKKNVELELEEGTRVARKAEKKNLTEALERVEKGVSQLEMEAKGDVYGTKETIISSKKEELNREKGDKEGKERSETLSTVVASSRRKDDEFQSSSSAIPLSKQNKPGLGKQIGDKMRSFLGGGNKKSHNSSNSSGILNACPGTVQGEEGWYEHGENERYYFVLVNGKWSLLYGPMTEDDFERFSNRVTAQMRSIELPRTYLHKSGYFLDCELRVQKEL